MDLTSIESAENQFIQVLEGFFVSVYDEKLLPSHGLNHHRRVWQTAKELIQILAAKNRLPDSFVIPGLLIASYLHDIGMAIDHGPRHGRQSFELCKRFLKENSLDEKEFPGMLEAVLEHDNKDYSSPTTNNIQTLLSVADDLDAFGITGIYRYIEIYTLREITHQELGSKIRDNAEKRYKHFQDMFVSEDELIQKHSQRYFILDNFFRSYYEQQQSGDRSGTVKIVEIITAMVNNKTDIIEIISKNKDNPDPVVSSFFENLEKEYSA